jgi:hypothetical protein
VAVSFIGGGNQSTRRKSPTCRKSVHLFCANCFHGNILYAHVLLAKSNVTINADCKIIILLVNWKWEYSYVIHNTQISDRNMVVMFIAKLLKNHLIYLCYFEILLKVNCSPFRSTRVHPGYLQSSCCSIFSFLCRILLIIVYLIKKNIQISIITKTSCLSLSYICILE